MRYQIPLLFGCVVMLCGSVLAGNEPDLDKLQGIWVTTSAVSNGAPAKAKGVVFKFEKDVLSFGMPGKPPMKWRVKLDSSSSPKQIDGIPFPETGAPPGTVIPGIYKLENNVLFISFPQGNLQMMRRPTDFEAKSGGRAATFVLKR